MFRLVKTKIWPKNNVSEFGFRFVFSRERSKCKKNGIEDDDLQNGHMYKIEKRQFDDALISNLYLYALGG